MIQRSSAQTSFGWSVYELTSGIVIRSGYSSDHKNAVNQVTNRYKEGFVLEYHEPHSTRIVGHQRKAHAPKRRSISQDEVKAWAGRLLRYTDWMIVRELEEGIPVPEEVKTYRRAVREACVQIETMQPIPRDFKQLKWWPPIPT